MKIFIKLSLSIILYLLTISAYGQAMYGESKFDHIHIIKKYETIAEIAQKYKITPSLLKKVNNIGQNTPIYIGQKLKVPELYNPKASKVNYYKDVSANEKYMFHKILKGESLEYLSKIYKINIYELMVINNLKNDEILHPGQLIKIPKIKKNNYKPANSSNKYYTVKKGDTLYSIAKKHGMDIGMLSRINKINHPYVIYINQKIKLDNNANNKPHNQNHSKKREYVIKADNIKNLHSSSRGSSRDSYSNTNKIKYITHRVNRGEALIDIARKYKVIPSGLVMLLIAFTGTFNNDPASLPTDAHDVIENINEQMRQ